MRFLLKCIFWLGGVFLLMPGIIGKQTDTAPPAVQPQQAVKHTPANPQTGNTSPSSDPVEQWLQAGKTLQEISTFCERNPALCIAGKATAAKAGEQALVRAKDAFDAMTGSSSVKPEIPVQTEPLAVKIPVPLPRPR